MSDESNDTQQDSGDKVSYIETSEHAIVAGSSGALAPGGRVPFDEDSDAHKFLAKQIKAGDPSVSHLSIVEVDPKAEQDAADEKQEMLEKADKIAAEARNEEARAVQEQLDKQAESAAEQDQHPDATDLPPQDEEAVALAKKSGGAQRASTQEDADDDKQQKQGRRSSKSKGGEE